MTTTTETLGTIIRERATIARSQADADAEFFSDLAAWEETQLQEEAHAALRRIARARLARVLRVPPDELGPAEVISFCPNPGYVGDRAFSGHVRFDLGDGLRVQVVWSGSAYINLLVGCAEGGCDAEVAGPGITSLDTLARELADPGVRRCQDHDRPF